MYANFRWRTLPRTLVRYITTFGLRDAISMARGAYRYQLHRRMLFPLVRQLVHGNEMLLDARDPGLSRELMIRGQREQQLRELIEDYVSPGDVVLDLGANIGYYTLQLCRLTGERGKVFALEPAPKNYELLERNLRLNGLGPDRVEVFPYAAADVNGTGTLHVSRQSNLHTLAPLDRDAKPGHHAITDETIEVPCVRLSDFLVGKPRVAFLRMDVEGYEVEVLRGLRDAVTQGTFTGRICFEVHTEKYHSTMRDMRAELQFLFSKGYEAAAVTSANETTGGATLHALGYRPYRVVRTHLDVNRGLYKGVKPEHVIAMVCDHGGVRDVVLQLPLAH